ncbi:MAG TPA: N-acetylmuramoyl-L-alanine amidase [Candidatus Blautia avicola]|uniref:N-acetylmuramoyl-L-alanine amidase n=1 Tax=Candidatus Blautia avicola TaxID=2838483 RepID=A0A9D2QRI6_9FIRM|nr:N-acetylmuramoyl-L-alanine amidase [Candidatus Blautia avicola]
MGKQWIKRGMAAGMLLAIYLLSREGAVMAAKEQVRDPAVIVIDSGHGGIDPGVVGIDGLEEKGINLKIAGYLGGYLEKEGFRVVFTREDDRGLYEEDSPNKKNQDLKNRCALIRETAPVLTISIHQNSYQDQSVCGPQVFYYTGSEKGKELAECIQETLNEGLEIQRPRKAKSNGSYYLLKKSEGIVNIVETGFLTNPREAELLQTEEYQKKCARAISSGILKFLKIVEKEGADVV